MNIFFLDENPRKAAWMHCDLHVNKMLSEYAQLLSAAHRILDGRKMRQVDEVSGLYVKRRRWVHPDTDMDRELWGWGEHNGFVQWVAETSGNYSYLWNLFDELHTVFLNSSKAGKPHAAYGRNKYLKYLPKNIPDGPLTEPVQGMPDYCKVEGDPVAAYRNVYCMVKSIFATWDRIGASGVQPPAWYSDRSDEIPFGEHVPKIGPKDWHGHTPPERRSSHKAYFKRMREQRDRVRAVKMKAIEDRLGVK